MIRSVTERVAEFATALRAVGAGKGRLDDLELDLTSRPAPERSDLPITVAPSAQETREKKLRTAFGHVGKVR